MGLSLADLESDILDCFKAGLDGGTVQEAAEKFASAIVSYASKAEVICAPGPILIPGTPPVPSSANGQMVKVSTADVGKVALEQAFAASFEAEDKELSIAADGVIAYVASSFTVFSGNGITVTGAAVMPPPPIKAMGFLPPVGVNGGASVEEMASLFAGVINTAFLATTFAGACVAPDGGLGPVAGTLL